MFAVATATNRASQLPLFVAQSQLVQVGATIRRGGRPDVPPSSELPGPDAASWAGLDAYLQLMR